MNKKQHLSVFYCILQNGNTVLHRAAAAGRLKTLRYLLMKGADMEAKNKVCDMYFSLSYRNQNCILTF
jgi:ankyrin repeat protein